MIVKIDDILGMIYALQLFPRQTEPLRALCPRGHKDRLESKRAQIIQGQVTLRADRDIPVIVKVGYVEHLPELLAQAILHSVFIGVNSVFCEPTRSNITIENNYSRPFVGEF